MIHLNYRKIQTRYFIKSLSKGERLFSKIGFNLHKIGITDSIRCFRLILESKWPLTDDSLDDD